jgi:hypothetical protein
MTDAQDRQGKRKREDGHIQRRQLAPVEQDSTIAWLRQMEVWEAHAQRAMQLCTPSRPWLSRPHAQRAVAVPAEPPQPAALLAVQVHGLGEDESFEVTVSADGGSVAQLQCAIAEAQGLPSEHFEVMIFAGEGHEQLPVYTALSTLVAPGALAAEVYYMKMNSAVLELPPLWARFVAAGGAVARDVFHALEATDSQSCRRLALRLRPDALFFLPLQRQAAPALLRQLLPSLTSLDLSRSGCSRATTSLLAALRPSAGPSWAGGGVTALDLSDAEHDIDVPALAALLSESRGLTALDLHGSRLKCSGVKQLLAAVRANPGTLRSLNLRANQLGVEGLRVVAEILQMSTALAELDVSGNGMWGGRLQALPGQACAAVSEPSGHLGMDLRTYERAAACDPAAFLRGHGGGRDAEHDSRSGHRPRAFRALAAAVSASTSLKRLVVAGDGLGGLSVWRQVAARIHAADGAGAIFPCSFEPPRAAWQLACESFLGRYAAACAGAGAGDLAGAAQEEEARRSAQLEPRPRAHNQEAGQPPARVFRPALLEDQFLQWSTGPLVDRYAAAEAAGTAMPGVDGRPLWDVPAEGTDGDIYRSLLLHCTQSAPGHS